MNIILQIFFNLLGLALFILISLTITYFIKKLMNIDKEPQKTPEKKETKENFKSNNEIKYEDIINDKSISENIKREHMEKKEYCKSLGYMQHYSHKLLGMDCGTCSDNDCKIITY